jgi:pyrimidine deaminase RibD-like protein/RNA-binding protein YhbY
MTSPVLTFRSLLIMSALFRSLAFVTRRPCNLNRLTRTNARSTALSTLSSDDEAFMMQAVQHAKNGLGQTFPNPAVGCVLVRQDTSEVIGSGFHPQAGLPHAEVFALFQAAGHVADGVQAAKSVIKQDDDDDDDASLLDTVQNLAKQYAESDGPAQLFGDKLADTAVTAYVTLEPCCHFGQTPPCAVSLALAKVDRVVVGFRDPNPRVDGGGVQLLEQAGVAVEIAPEGETVHQACAGLVTNFVKRISPRDDWVSGMNGAMRGALRKLASQKKAAGTAAEIPWGGETIPVDDNLEAAIDELTLDPKWMEHVDSVLWKHELIVLRLNRAIAKKKGAKLLGERIAKQLQAHVAQTVGHTCLLYRPGMPKVLDLEQLMLTVEKETPSE